MPKLMNGIHEEFLMIDHLDNHYYKELNQNLKTMITNIFGIVHDDDLIKCEKIDQAGKPDFYITCKGEKVGVSMKTGKSRMFHQEDIKSFILFIRECGISAKTQKIILLYHYGDGTMDGTGKKRYSYIEVVNKMKSLIEEANKELNSNPEFMKKCLARFMFVGMHNDNPVANYVYSGNVDYGVVAGRNQITKYVLRRKNRQLMSLHIGPLTIRPHARYVNEKVVPNEKRRNTVSISWSHCQNDFDYIARTYVEQ